MSAFTDVNEQGLELIKSFEGFSPKPYLCPAGKNTIGYGHIILPTEIFVSLTKDEAEKLLVRDLGFAIKSVIEKVTTKLNTNQFSALVSFVFNLGAAAFSKSTLLQVVNSADHLNVPAEFIKWKMAGGAPLKGLLLRRLAEASLYLS